MVRALTLEATWRLGRFAPLGDILTELSKRSTLGVLQRLVELVGHILPVNGAEQLVVPIQPVGRADRQGRRHDADSHVSLIRRIR